jgi:hypothetical protein
LDHFSSEQVTAPWHRLKQLLATIIQSPTQFERALHQRIVSNEGIGPDGLHQFRFADQLAGVFHKVPESFMHLGAKLDFNSCLKQTPAY